MSTVTSTDLKGKIPLLGRGKVRDVYQLDDNSLLFVATDRISAYDVVMENVRFDHLLELNQPADSTFPRASRAKASF